MAKMALIFRDPGLKPEVKAGKDLSRGYDINLVDPVPPKTEESFFLIDLEPKANSPSTLQEKTGNWRDVLSTRDHNSVEATGEAPKPEATSKPSPSSLLLLTEGAKIRNRGSLDDSQLNLPPAIPGANSASRVPVYSSNKSTVVASLNFRGGSAESIWWEVCCCKCFGLCE